MIYKIPCEEDCICAWGPTQPATLKIITSGFTDGPCTNILAPDHSYRGEISSGVNGTFAAITITPHTDGWMADFGTIGQLDIVFHDGLYCVGDPFIDSSSIITVTLDFTISTQAYVLTWLAYNPTPFTMATASGTYPASTPTVINDSIYPTNDPYNWATGGVIISS